MNTEENNQEQKYLDIYPISKGKRILTFLADFFITLITSIFLFNIIIYPIGKTIAKTDEKTNEIYTLEKEKYDLLYDSKILFYDSDYKYSYINNLETSMKKFIYYYTGDNTDLENEFIRHFYIDLRNKDLNFLLNFYKKYSNREISHNRFNKILYNNLFSAEEEPSFFNVPDEYTDYNFVQVCSMEFEKDFAMPKEPGKFFIPVLFNSKISSLVMPYPDKYLSKLLKV